MFVSTPEACLTHLCCAKVNIVGLWKGSARTVRMGHISSAFVCALISAGDQAWPRSHVYVKAEPQLRVEP